MSQPTFDPDRQSEWKVELCGNNKIGLICPHCGGRMLVNRSKWVRGSIPRHWEHQDIFKKLRACTYCTQVARIPVHMPRK